MASSSNATMETPEKRFFGSKSCTVLEKWPASGEDIIPVRNPYPTIPDPNEYNQTSSRGALKEQDESSSYTLAERIVYKMDKYEFPSSGKMRVHVLTDQQLSLQSHSSGRIQEKRQSAVLSTMHEWLECNNHER